METRYLSTQEVGALLGVTRQTIRNWIRKDHVKAFHIGQNLKISPQEAIRIMQYYELPVPDWLKREVQGTQSSPEQHNHGKIQNARP
jgi:excisionase family DNA binding protein